MTSAGFAVGSLSTWLILVVLLGSAWLFRAGGGNAAIDSLEKANRVLVQRVDTLEREGAEKDRLIAELQGRTDVTLATNAAIQPLLDWSFNHEIRAQERHEMLIRGQEAHLGVLKGIADEFARLADRFDVDN